MRKNLTVRNWIKKKFGKDIPSKCNEAFKDNSLSALPISFRNSYIKDLEFPIPLLLPDSEILEIVTEYNDSAQEALAQAEYNLELGIEDEEDVDCTSIFLYNSVSTSLLNSTKFYPDFDYLSREIIEELKKDESQESWTESMAPHGFMGDWDEVYNLLSPIGLMNAYTWMSSMDITATHQYDSGGGEFKFGELFLNFLRKFCKHLTLANIRVGRQAAEKKTPPPRRVVASPINSPGRTRGRRSASSGASRRRSCRSRTSATRCG